MSLFYLSFLFFTLSIPLYLFKICEIELIPPPGGFPSEEFFDYDESPAQPDQPQSSTAQPEVQPTSAASK